MLIINVQRINKLSVLLIALLIPSGEEANVRRSTAATLSLLIHLSSERFVRLIACVKRGAPQVVSVVISHPFLQHDALRKLL